MDLRIFPSTNNDTILGPLKYGTKATRYEPVDCDFTDDLEFVSIYKLKVEVIGKYLMKTKCMVIRFPFASPTLETS